MAEANANNKDNRRRRRILEQGSDRLAFITGRIQTPPPPLPDPHPNTPFPSTVEDSLSTSQNPQPYPSDVSNRKIQAPPFATENEISSVPTSEPEPVPEPQPEPEPVQILPESKPFILPSDITGAINASKVTRLCCSVVMAVLVLSSYLRFSFFDTNFVKSVVGFRPLYLVLLTNLTVVVATIVSRKQRGFGRRTRNTNSSDSQLARALELGLLVKNVADAVFMDCAVYAIVLICGLSLLHT
ncbi:uncharacterized protein LOC113859030 [Abrus precatorius]|uniref:Uncharacterized protein LOC113859030 n=1 Tax=Abrus precatorius TaxID=3816 RepID=A0A8B8KUT6_ABRPR|nr:uncharacterized protein LOC113859030 [Abrus precatorius]